MLYPHNQDTYDEICSLFNSGINDLCLVQGMGTGKSFVFMELAKNYFRNKKICFVVPKTTIERNMRNYDDFAVVDKHVEFKTYNYFDDDDSIFNTFANFDVIVVDEAHHIGSEIYGRHLQALLELIKTKKDKWFIAMTATPRRDSDKVDVTGFFDATVHGKSTIECIQDGLMPQLEYLVCSPDVNSIDRKKFNVQVDYFDSIDLLGQIIKENHKNRWLCYYGTIRELKKNRDLLDSLFPDYRILEISSDTEHSQNDIDNIKPEEKIVICSVDKLLEGIHLPHMQGILLFRRVHSVTVFTQIFGRITAVGEIENPIFVDCTATGIRMQKKLEGFSPNSEGTLFRRKENTRPVLITSLKNKKYYDITQVLWLLEEQERYKTFDEFLNEVDEYMAEHNCSINDIKWNAVSKNGYRIGQWLVRQNYLLNRMSEENRKKAGY